MKWSVKDKKIAKELYELALQRDYDRLISDIKKRVPKNRDEIWKLRDFLNKQSKEFNRIYEYRYSTLLETFAYLAGRNLLSKEELQSLDEEKFTYVNNILKIIIPQVYQLKVLLEGTNPTVYRTIEIEESATFYKLHAVIQIAFDWYNAHLHEFRKKDLLISDPDFYKEVYDFEDKNILDEKQIKISEVLKTPKDRIRYLYDFGDSWGHIVTLEKIIDAKEGVVYPRCIRGKRCAPPEDVGGVWGFEDFKEIMANPNHKEYEEYKEWYGGKFEPEEIDLEEINDKLQDFMKEKFRIEDY